VIVTPVPMFLGAPHAREMPRIVRKSDGGKNRQTHAILTFDRDVQGPVLIGAGRYRGYGLCRPLRGEEGET
jgi:CRISPR-associated protein Csb2